jgi:hypothetical protein
VVFVTVVLLEEPLLPPLKIATSKRINTAPPTTHTQGAVHHSVCSVVVVFIVVVELELDEELSCAQQISINKLQSNDAAKDFNAAFFNNRFIGSFLIYEFVSLYCISRTAPIELP